MSARSEVAICTYVMILRASKAGVLLALVGVAFCGCGLSLAVRGPNRRFRQYVMSVDVERARVFFETVGVPVSRPLGW